MEEPQDPSAACLMFGVVAASGTEGCHWNVDQVSPSLIGQWVFYLVWTPPTPLWGYDADINGMCSFSATQRYKSGVHTSYSSRDGAFFVFPSNITCTDTPYLDAPCMDTMYLYLNCGCVGDIPMTSFLSDRTGRRDVQAAETKGVRGSPNENGECQYGVQAQC